MPSSTRKTAKRGTVVRSRPAMPLRQFQVVETRDGKDWTIYALDRKGEMWFRYWREHDQKKDERYVPGEWDPEWRPLADDTLA